MSNEERSGRAAAEASRRREVKARRSNARGARLWLMRAKIKNTRRLNKVSVNIGEAFNSLLLGKYTLSYNLKA